MRLNPDCIRDILFTVEDLSGFASAFRFVDTKEFSRLEKYSNEEVRYHIEQCRLANFLTKVDWDLAGCCLIHDLTPKGHEFLANIRADNNWNKTKAISKKVGSESLSILTQIAAQVIISMIPKI